MSKIEKTKRITLIVLGFSLSAYLIYSGFEILNDREPEVSVEKSV